jgi:transposase
MEDLSMAGTRRYFSPSFKRQVVMERLSGQASGAALARRYEISPNLIVRWEKAYHEGRLEDAPTPDMKALEVRNRELERLVGKLTLEIEFLKKAGAYSREKASEDSLIVSGGALRSRRRAR